MILKGVLIVLIVKKMKSWNWLKRYEINSPNTRADTEQVKDRTDIGA